MNYYTDEYDIYEEDLSNPYYKTKGLKSKKYRRSWNEDEDMDILKEILEDKDLENLDEIIIGLFELDSNDGVSHILDGLIENKDKLQHIKSFFIGDMDYEENEISWIVQSNYEEFLKAFPNLEKLRIKGSMELSFGKLEHKNLKELEIISGGTGTSIFKELEKSNLPKLEKLKVYLGDENYGFSGNSEVVRPLCDKNLFPKLKSLGLVNSEFQDEVTKIVLESNILDQLESLQLGYGVLTDLAGQKLIDNKEKLKNIKSLDLEYHYLTYEMMEKLEKEFEEIDLNISNKEEPYYYDDGDVYYSILVSE